MKFILFIIIILSLIFGQWVGKPFSWVLTPIVENPYGAIIVFCLLILSFIRLFNIFTSETRVNGVGFSSKPHYKSKSKDK